MKTIYIYPNLVDVFSGDGWENWSRWRCIKNHWIQIKGTPIQHSALIIKTLTKEG